MARYEVTANVWVDELQLVDVKVVQVLDILAGRTLRGLIDLSRGWSFRHQVQNAALSIDPDRLVWLDRAEWQWGGDWDGTLLGAAASDQIPVAI